jgi:hypothetical protein
MGLRFELDLGLELDLGFELDLPKTSFHNI